MHSHPGVSAHDCFLLMRFSLTVACGTPNPYASPYTLTWTGPFRPIYSILCIPPLFLVLLSPCARACMCMRAGCVVHAIPRGCGHDGGAHGAAHGAAVHGRAGHQAAPLLPVRDDTGEQGCWI
eukprot:scaffold119168_cov20-Tisochrysis_lutea.AAC.2